MDQTLTINGIAHQIKRVTVLTGEGRDHISIEIDGPKDIYGDNVYFDIKTSKGKGVSLSELLGFDPKQLTVRQFGSQPYQFSENTDETA